MVINFDALNFFANNKRYKHKHSSSLHRRKEMLKMTQNEVKILDALRGATPSVAAMRLGITEQKVYNTIHYFRRKTQNAQDFLAVAKGQYGYVLSRRLATPKIKPSGEDERLLIETHNEEESK